jgi:hypothetical protein
MAFFQQMIKRPAIDQGRHNWVWREQVYTLKDEYEMNP